MNTYCIDCNENHGYEAYNTYRIKYVKTTADSW